MDNEKMAHAFGRQHEGDGILPSELDDSTIHQVTGRTDLV